MLSGILGDGNFKKNGKYGYYYRESHAEDEIEYLYWKAKHLQPFLSKSKIREINGKGFNKQKMFELMTRTSISFAKFAIMKKENVILNLDIRGLILFILDDGWINKKNVIISGGELTELQKKLLIDKFNEYGCSSIHLTKRGEFFFSSKDYNKIKEYTLSFLPQNLDIIIKKFQK